MIVTPIQGVTGVCVEERFDAVAILVGLPGPVFLCLVIEVIFRVMLGIKGIFSWNAKEAVCICR